MDNLKLSFLLTSYAENENKDEYWREEINKFIQSLILEERKRVCKIFKISKMNTGNIYEQGWNDCIELAVNKRIDAILSEGEPKP